VNSSAALLFAVLTPCCIYAQALNVPWSGYGHDPQHTAVSAIAAQSLNKIHWSTPVDLNAPGGGDLYIHYGSISVTAGNTVLVPVKTGTTDGFEVLAYTGSTAVFSTPCPPTTLCRPTMTGSRPIRRP